jgi:hypothetical protein
LASSVLPAWPRPSTNKLKFLRISFATPISNTP